MEVAGIQPAGAGEVIPVIKCGLDFSPRVLNAILTEISSEGRQMMARIVARRSDLSDELKRRVLRLVGT